MPAVRVKRPVVRSFTAPFEREAAAHVRAGGHAVVWDSPSNARLVVPQPIDADERDLALWSLADLGRWKWATAKRGPLKGLAFMRVPSDLAFIVQHRAERDSVMAGPTVTMRLDCLACGACCRANEVILEDVDIERFEDAGRKELTRRPYARRRRDGRVVLTLKTDKRCKHLADDNKCDIYALRPDACSTFPVGSEGCLFSREEELGIYEGAATPY